MIIFALLLGVLVVAAVFSFVVSDGNDQYPDHSQNRGEATVSGALQLRFGAPDYYLLNNVTLPQSDGTTQVDHVLVSRFGVFVIETKDYSGWIFGKREDRFWTQTHKRAKHKFQNPIRQNYRHVCAIRDLLSFLPNNKVHSAVVFTGSAEFKTAVPAGVFDVNGLIAFVKTHSKEVMSSDRVQSCLGRLEAARLPITKATDVEHVQYLQRRYATPR